MFCREKIVQRNDLCYFIRNFLIERGLLEVDTATLAPRLIPEATIRPFDCRCRRWAGGEDRYLLIPSPEIWMKRLLALFNISEGIFQFSRSFRAAEPEDQLHGREFTMLEWYLPQCSYTDNLTFCEEILTGLTNSSDRQNLQLPLPRVRISELFDQILNLDLEHLLARKGALLSVARSLDLIEKGATEPDDEIFQRIFVDRIEPNLPHNGTLFVLDYPAIIPTTAARLSNTPYAQRWELYLDGIEVANCYTEESERRMLDDYYHKSIDSMKSNDNQYPIDWELPSIYAHLPHCSGVALGIERLLHFIYNSDSVADYLPYGSTPQSDR